MKLQTQPYSAKYCSDFDACVQIASWTVLHWEELWNWRVECISVQQLQAEDVKYVTWVTDASVNPLNTEMSFWKPSSYLYDL